MAQVLIWRRLMSTSPLASGKVVLHHAQTRRALNGFISYFSISMS